MYNTICDKKDNRLNGTSQKGTMNKESFLFRPMDYIYIVVNTPIHIFQTSRITNINRVYLSIEDPYIGACTTYVRYYSSAIFAIVSFATYKYHRQSSWVGILG